MSMRIRAAAAAVLVQWNYLTLLVAVAQAAVVDFLRFHAQLPLHKWAHRKLSPLGLAALAVLLRQQTRLLAAMDRLVEPHL
jgi:hypothetical protein